MKKKTLYKKYVSGEIEHELSDDDRRAILRGHYRECERIREIQRTWPYKDQYVLTKSLRIKVIPAPKPPDYPSYPEVIRGLTCGAKTRKGTPCKLPADTWHRGRCKFHGGTSTGPKTEEGKRKSAENGRKPKKSRQVLPEK